jgi:hypothetical protein
MYIANHIITSIVQRIAVLSTGIVWLVKTAIRYLFSINIEVLVTAAIESQ